MTQKSEFILLLDFLNKEKGVITEDLASILKVSSPTISNYRNNIGNIPDKIGKTNKPIQDCVKELKKHIKYEQKGFDRYKNLHGSKILIHDNFPISFFSYKEKTNINKIDILDVWLWSESLLMREIGDYIEKNDCKVRIVIANPLSVIPIQRDFGKIGDTTSTQALIEHSIIVTRNKYLSLSDDKKDNIKLYLFCMLPSMYSYRINNKVIRSFYYAGYSPETKYTCQELSEGNQEFNLAKDHFGSIITHESTMEIDLSELKFEGNKLINMEEVVFKKLKKNQVKFPEIKYLFPLHLQKILENLENTESNKDYLPN